MRIETICPECGRDNTGFENEPCAPDCPTRRNIAATIARHYVDIVSFTATPAEMAQIKAGADPDTIFETGHIWDSARDAFMVADHKVMERARRIARAMLRRC